MPFFVIKLESLNKILRVQKTIERELLFSDNMEVVEYQKEHEEGVKNVWKKSKNDKDQMWEGVLEDIENTHNQTYVVINEAHFNLKRNASG